MPFFFGIDAIVEAFVKQTDTCRPSTMTLQTSKTEPLETADSLFLFLLPTTPFVIARTRAYQCSAAACRPCRSLHARSSPGRGVATS